MKVDVNIEFPIFLLLHLIVSIFALDNGVSRTPVMGWLAWERFQCNTECKNGKKNCISEDLFMEMADYLVKDGYRDAGYKYINIDDCWMYHRRNPSGELVPDPQRFPKGIKFLADYMHSKGLKLGMYQDYGETTCMGYPGLIGHMEQDVKKFAEWDIDMLKIDGCNSRPPDLDNGYIKLGHLLNATGKPIVYSCSWPYYQLASGMQPDYMKISKYCNMWRIYNDIHDSWSSIQSVIDFFGDNQEVLTPAVGPGRWADPDMLMIGNFHLTERQAQIHMAVWAILAAPLLMSNDLRTIQPNFKDILLNPRVIEIDQDPLGIPGKRVYIKDGIEVWKRPITPVHEDKYSYALLFISRRPRQKTVEVRFHLGQFNLTNPQGYSLHELIGDANYGIISNLKTIKIELMDEDCVLLKAKLVHS